MLTARGSNKRAVVVGACGGIGAATVDRLTRDGWDVFGLDLPRQQAAQSKVARMMAVDVANPASVQRAFSELASYGRIDLLAVCSGVVDTEKVAASSLEHWQTMLAVNLTGPFLCCRSAYPLLNEGGRIVLVGSLAGRTGGVLTGAAYAAAKAGLEGLAKSMAQELAARRITVNVVAPGAIETPMVLAHPPERRQAMAEATPLKRIGRPEEVAAAIAYLASADAGFVTGAVLHVNGGIRME